MHARNILKTFSGALAVIAVAGMATSAVAQQEERLPQGLVIEVTPQSWLDPPNVPVEGSLPGTMRRQVIMDTYIARDSAFIARPDSFGESVLPRGRGPNINLRTID
jgi:hypothetical protein